MNIYIFLVQRSTAKMGVFTPRGHPRSAFISTTIWLVTLSSLISHMWRSVKVHIFAELNQFFTNLTNFWATWPVFHQHDQVGQFLTNLTNSWPTSPSWSFLTNLTNFWPTFDQLDQVGQFLTNLTKLVNFWQTWPTFDQLDQIGHFWPTWPTFDQLDQLDQLLTNLANFWPTLPTFDQLLTNLTNLTNLRAQEVFAAKFRPFRSSFRGKFWKF